MNSPKKVLQYWNVFRMKVQMTTPLYSVSIKYLRQTVGFQAVFRFHEKGINRMKETMVSAEPCF